MCGICGIAYTHSERPASRETLVRMADIMHHRGPDSDGFYAAPGIGLGFRRLSIVDLETGDQPIANEDGTVIVVCNGEIYNDVELRRRLVAAGHRFSTASDVEVIVHLYEEHGADFVRHLRGMFGLALWDARRKRLVLARDRLGIKPLHYALTPDGLFFGSEQKAILASGAVAAVPDIQALRQLFAYGRVVSPRTFVAGIQRLPAGHCLTWTAGHVELRQYWDATFPSRHDYDVQTTEQQWADALRGKLTESVRLHLRSDVPLGAWLSGGVDSSSVAALMSRLVGERVSTFTLRFEEAKFDELRDQKSLDDFPQYGLVGHRITCRRADLERLPKGVWHSEDLSLGGVAIGQMMVAEATAAHVKVVLTGEGSDEILGGYSWYSTRRILQPVFLLPRPLRRLLASVPALRRRWPGAAGTIAGPREMGFERYSRSITSLRGQAADKGLFSADITAELRRQGEADDAPALPAAFASWHPFAQMQYFDINHRLADGVVLSLDRTSMAYSVEARVPFLDHEMVEFCARIPPRLKMKWLREKHILRRAMENVLPPDIVRRKKWAFRLPIDEWLREDLPPFAAELLSESALREAGYFDPEQVAILRRRHRERKENLGQTLGGVLCVQLWHDLFRRQRLERAGAPCVTG
ncbi:MAG TPA: asparagine synthase (glutamine-hydrolyzing) [Casimicrobiaceae bacterium]